MTGLLPCPFCGYNEAIARKNMANMFNIECPVCGAQGERRQSNKDARTSWNCRTVTGRAVQDNRDIQLRIVNWSGRWLVEKGTACFYLCNNGWHIFKTGGCSREDENNANKLCDLLNTSVRTQGSGECVSQAPSDSQEKKE